MTKRRGLVWIGTRYTSLDESGYIEELSRDLAKQGFFEQGSVRLRCTEIQPGILWAKVIGTYSTSMRDFHIWVTHISTRHHHCHMSQQTNSTLPRIFSTFPSSLNVSQQTKSMHSTHLSTLLSSLYVFQQPK